MPIRRRILVLGFTATALIGQLIVASRPVPGMVFLAIALVLVLAEAWLYPRANRSVMVVGAALALLGIAYWREPRGWFFLALGVIELARGLRKLPAAPTVESVAEPAASGSATDSGLPGLEGAGEMPPAPDLAHEAPPQYTKGLLFGLPVAVAGAFAWFFVTKVTGWELGLIAWGIGRAVGRTVLWGAGGRGDRQLQVISAVLGGLGILGGYYLILRESLLKVLAQRGVHGVSEFRIFQALVRTVAQHPNIIGAFGFLFIVIGIYDAWIGARRRQVRYGLPGKAA